MEPIPMAMSPEAEFVIDLPEVDDADESPSEEPRPFKIYSLALKKNRTAFQHEVDNLVKNGEINDWLESLRHIINGLPKEDHVDYLDPMLRTDDHDRKFLLLLSAIRSAGSDKGNGQSSVRTIARKLLEATPSLAWHGEAGETALHTAASSGVEQILQNVALHLTKAGKLGQALNQHWQKRTPLETAVSCGRLSAVKFLSDRDRNLNTRCSILSLAIDKMHEEIFTELLTKCQDLLKSDRGVLRKIIERDAMIAWDKTTKVKAFTSLLAGSPDLLHAAVEHRRLSMVKDIIALQPQLVAKRDSNKRTVLSYNAPSTEDSEQVRELKENIRGALLPAIVRELDPASTRSMFIEANNHLDEITLNLSNFDRPGHSFASFLDAIDEEKTRKLLPMCSNVVFESTLRYLGLPDFDRMVDEPLHAAYSMQSPLQEKNSKYLRWRDEPLQETSSSRTIRKDYVAKVLAWLHKIKGVRNIYHLRVPDSLNNPHPEELIEKAIKPFHVEVLDWRRVDLSIDSIVDSAPTVRELHLYSSGNRAVLSHWLGDQGLARLVKLEKLEIVIYKHNLSEARAMSLEKSTETHLELLRNAKPGLEASVRLANWDRRKTSIHGESSGEKPNHLPYELTGLRPFLDFYGGFQKSRTECMEGKNEDVPLHPVRVAVIDNGVDDYSFDTKIKGGISFVHLDGKESNWFIASHPHGTQMAKFIQQIDPFCEIYPIKVGDHTTDIVPSRVVEAINNAVREDVDIISMSLALSAPSPALREAIANATRKKILIFCSTADNDTRHSTVWPADYDECFSIACRDKAEAAPEWSSDAKATYKFQGRAFATDEICYIENNTHQHTVYGSSVATAIAAGVASLTLACGRYANNNSILSPKMFIGDIFHEMTGGDPRSKFIQPDTFFPSEVLDQERGKKFITENFMEGGKARPW